MRLFKGSRFRNVSFGRVMDTDLEVNAVFALCKTTAQPQKNTAIYTAKAGDTFESIAYQEYGDANKWYVLASVNPSIFWPLDLTAGTKIYVPSRAYAEMV